MKGRGRLMDSENKNIAEFDYDYKNGMEYFDLTSKYKLSVTTIRNITAQCQKKEKNGNNEEK